VKAALARTHSMTCRTLGGSLMRRASWSAERQFRFRHETIALASPQHFVSRLLAPIGMGRAKRVNFDETAPTASMVVRQQQ
jgi:hypothetical protein